MGEDWKGKFDFLQEHCQVLYLPRTKDISSTDLKQQLSKIAKINLHDINEAFEILKRLKHDFE
jgi:glycerol-3-phosphate cytidylyltransferase